MKQHLYSKKLGSDPHFRWRGAEISRIEAISDGIFAITITLLIVASAGSDSFYDIWAMVKDLPAFFVSFSLIIYAWFEHYRFFRRYGLEDGLTVALNSFFLFLIMILAFPLKFLTTFLWHLIIGQDTSALFIIPADTLGLISEVSSRILMMYFYGASLMGVFLVLLLMHWRAFNLRKKLDLDKIETLITVVTIRHHIITIGITALSLVVLTITKNPGASGIVYFLMPFIHIPVGIYEHQKINKMA